jgi:hypothetical protein
MTKLLHLWQYMAIINLYNWDICVLWRMWAKPEKNLAV